MTTENPYAEDSHAPGILAGRFLRWLRDECVLIVDAEGARRWEETTAEAELGALWAIAAHLEDAASLGWGTFSEFANGVLRIWGVREGGTVGPLVLEIPGERATAAEDRDARQAFMAGRAVAVVRNGEPVETFTSATAFAERFGTAWSEGQRQNPPKPREGLELYRFGICSSCEREPRVESSNLCAGCTRREYDRMRARGGRGPMTDDEWHLYGPKPNTEFRPMDPEEWREYVRGVRAGTINEPALRAKESG